MTTGGKEEKYKKVWCVRTATELKRKKKNKKIVVPNDASELLHQAPLILIVLRAGLSHGPAVQRGMGYRCAGAFHAKCTCAFLGRKTVDTSEGSDPTNHRGGAEVNKKLDTHTKSLGYAKNTNFQELRGRFMGVRGCCNSFSTS
jgi:hypothetical protein